MYTKHVCALQIALRSMKSVELRVGGSVEPPNIDISVVSYWMCVFTLHIYLHSVFVVTNSSNKHGLRKRKMYFIHKSISELLSFTGSELTTEHKPHVCQPACLNLTNSTGNRIVFLH